MKPQIPKSTRYLLERTIGYIQEFGYYHLNMKHAHNSIKMHKKVFIITLLFRNAQIIKLFQVITIENVTIISVTTVQCHFHV